VKLAELYTFFSNRIEDLRNHNETLEVLARATFKSWFVDFDPVRAKAEGREPDFMDAAIAAIFPSRFQDSEVGPIPNGWQVGSILNIATLLSGGTPKTSREEYWNGLIKWASAKDVSQCSETFLLQTERTITSCGLIESSTKLIPAYCTVVVARGATTGRVAIFGDEMAMNQTCYALSSRTNTPFTLYCLFRNAIAQLVHSAHGSVFETITTTTFTRTRVLIPPSELLARCESILEPLFNKVLLGSSQAITLSALRETLLPRLISGKLPVPEAEAVLARIV
jgi:type I restriction enzyme, S subunit